MPVDRTAYSVYFSDQIPGFFGWVVPENETTARVGIATTKNPKLVFMKFMERLDKPKMLEMQGGLIPKYNPRMTIQVDNTYLVGDAATQVKATTGGGIVPGMKAAECLAKAILNKTSYKKELKIVNRELITSLFIRNRLDRFQEKDYNKLIDIIDSPKMKNILNKHDRDNPSTLLFKSLIAEPKLLFFAGILLRAKRL
jgi:flavin-dependent dehydrogenase